MTNFLDLVSKRQSVRGYTDAPVEKEKIDRCLEAARLSPSACNAQPWKFVVVTDSTIKNAIADATTTTMLSMNHFTKQAPVHIVVILENPNFTSKLGSTIRDKDFTLMDLGMATLQFCLQATEEGLGTCILGWFNEKKVKGLLKIPRGKRAMLVITLGYPSSGDIREKKRKTITEISNWNEY